MASLVLGTVGSIFGGPIGGMIGSAIGGLVDAALFAPKIPDGPRLETLRSQGASYGDPINRIYGSTRVAGSVIWAADLIERTKRVGGSLFSKGQKVYEYDASFAVAFAENVGTPVHVLRIWADGKRIYEVDKPGANRSASKRKVSQIRIYDGSETQNPDPLIQSYEGADNTPAYRGVAYVVIERLQLKDFGNRIPQITLEVQASGKVFNGAIVARSSESSYSTHAPVVSSNGDKWIFTAQGASITAHKMSIDGNNIKIDKSVAHTSTPNSPSIAWVKVSANGRYALVCTPSGSLSHFRAFDMQGETWRPQGASSYLSVVNFAYCDFISDTRFFDCSTSTFGHLYEIRDGGIYREYSLNTRSAHCVAIDDGAVLFNPNGSGSGASRRFQSSIIYRAYGDVSEQVLGSFWPTENAGYIISTAVHIGDNRLFLEISHPTNAALPRYYLVAHVGSYGMRVDSPVLESTGFTVAGVSGAAHPASGVATMVVPGIVAMIGGSGLYVEFAVGSGVCELNRAPMRLGDPKSLGNPGLPGNVANKKNFISSDGAYVFTAAGHVRAISAYIESPDVSIAHILASEFQRSGLSQGDFDVDPLKNVHVRGLALNNPSSARQVAETLAVYRPFDLVESSGRIRAVPRKKTVDVEIEVGTTALAPSGESADSYEIDRVPDTDLPRKLSIQYVDTDKKYEQGVQHAFRETGTSTEHLSIQMPLAVSGRTALRIAEERLFTLVNEREMVKLSVPREHMLLDPGDVVAFKGRPMRITRGTLVGQHLELEAVPLYLPAYSSSAIGSDVPPPLPPLMEPSHSELYLLDLPPLSPEHASAPGAYFAARPKQAQAPWVSAEIFRSSDGGNIWETVGRTSDAATAGLTLLPLAAGPTDLFDSKNRFEVTISGGSLESVTLDALLDDPLLNLALLGGELLQFATAERLSTNQYRLSGLLRGRFGTDRFIGSHAMLESFTLIDAAVEMIAMQDHEFAQPHTYTAVTEELSILDSDRKVATLGAGTITPFAPVHLQSKRSGDQAKLSWVRRSRSATGWWDFADVPLDEPEQYEIEILTSAGQVLATLSSSTPSITINRADYPSAYAFRVYQISSRVGRGPYSESTI